MKFYRVLPVFALVSLGFACAADAPIEDLRKEISELRRQLNEREAKGSGTAAGKVLTIADSKYGVSQPVTTKTGKLTIGGLLQIWNSRIDEDHEDVFGDHGGNAGSGGTGEALDNNSYRIRRTELRFTMDLHENIRGFVNVDPARTATSFPGLPSNQGLFKGKRENPSIALGTPISETSVGRVQTGAGAPNRVLRDAYVNFHSLIPHHDVSIGLMQPHMGEEGVRDPGYLDFAERAMVTQLNDIRDIGIQVHGSWWNEKLQYWGGIFNGSTDFFATNNDVENRSDDNDAKDFLGSLMVRPLWDHNCYGGFELGYSVQYGIHGEAGDLQPNDGSPVNGLNRLETAAIRHGAWFYYKAAGLPRGWWVRAEGGYQKDRSLPYSINVLGLGSGEFGEQAAPNPFSRSGWQVSTGYKLSDSIFAERLNKKGFFNKLMKPVEFAFRYESFQNILMEDLAKPDAHTDVFKTDVFTGGVNYYLHGYKYRVQVNYMVVNEHEDGVNPARGLREVRNNVFIFTYQMLF